MNDNFYHLPVMTEEVSNYLITKKDGYYIDCTFGGGGHSSFLLDKYKNIKIIAFDQDSDSFINMKNNKNLTQLSGRITFCKDNFRNILKNIAELKINKVNGLFADLGVSSKQLDDKSRGFSFNSNDMLDMRMNQNQSLTAYEAVNTFSKEKLQEIFFKYGEESFAKQIAQEIVNYRCKGAIKTCDQLQAIVAGVKWAKGKTNPATKIFQALRIYVNNELESLQEMLNAIPQVLAQGARAVILTYHSLEDRIVKQSFKEYQNIGLQIINKKVITAGQQEIKNNPRSRSAKMRVIEQKNG